MKRLLALLLTSFILFGAAAQASDNCTTVEPNLNLHIPYLGVAGQFYDIVLNSHSDPSAPYGLYWSIGQAEVNIPSGNFATLDIVTLAIHLPCLSINGTDFTLTLDRYVNWADPSGFYWSLGSFQPAPALPGTQSDIPEYDVYDLACRLLNVCHIPKTLPAPAVPLTIGATKKFWLTDSDTSEMFQITATLLYITPQTYFWAENGAAVDQSGMKTLMDTFDQKIIPTDREFFGSEWAPGVDNDPHLYVLYASDIGGYTAGYFAAADEYNPIVSPYSNGHEGFVLNGKYLSLTDDYTYLTIAHEFVHMIQWASDRNETDWLLEGFAELGAFLNGYDLGDAASIYAESPDLQLNNWSSIGSPDSYAHYGQSFLYLAYFLDRFGKQATEALNVNPANDLDSVDGTLEALNSIDPQTGKLITADDVFMDWAAAMYLMDETAGDGRYTYHNYPDAPLTSSTETISDCPQSTVLRDVHQYGIDYINISCAGDHTLRFQGATSVQPFSVSPLSGAYGFATNLGNNSDMKLTRDFDFTNSFGSITLSYSMWHDIEQDYDYVYLEISEDGAHWQILTTPSGTGDNPSGNSYGWGYNGASNHWIKENIDLSQYAGKKVTVRFEYVTDAAVTGEGFFLDDVSVNAVNYHSDFETDDGGWVADGFSRIQNNIPQTFRLALITKGSTGKTVQSIGLGADQLAEIPLSLKNGDEAILVVTGTARATRNNATYQIEIK
jgi:immune inhibitor A